MHVTSKFVLALAIHEIRKSFGLTGALLVLCAHHPVRDVLRDQGLQVNDSFATRNS
jgi:hypothetical protein